MLAVYYMMRRRLPGESVVTVTAADPMLPLTKLCSDFKLQGIEQDIEGLAGYTEYGSRQCLAAASLSRTKSVAL